MKVKDLIKRLKGYDGDCEVHFSYDYGDHWHTEVAPKVKRLDYGEIGYSDYHSMDQVVKHADRDDFEEVKEVVVLS